VIIQYIENIDISFSISIYRILSWKKYWIYSIYRDIFYISRYFTSQVYFFVLLHY